MRPTRKSHPHFCNCELRCPVCIRRFWVWAEMHTRGRAPGREPSFYEAAAKSPGRLISNPPGATP